MLPSISGPRCTACSQLPEAYRSRTRTGSWPRRVLLLPLIPSALPTKSVLNAQPFFVPPRASLRRMYRESTLPLSEPNTSATEIIASVFAGTERSAGRNTSSPQWITLCDSTQVPARRAKRRRQRCSPQWQRPGSTQRTKSSVSERSRISTLTSTASCSGEDFEVFIYGALHARPHSSSNVGCRGPSPGNVETPASGESSLDDWTPPGRSGPNRSGASLLPDNVAGRLRPATPPASLAVMPRAEAPFYPQ